jgi:hypothetical protein
MTLKEEITRITQAAEKCGIRHGDTTRAFALGFNYAMKYGDWRSVEDELPPNGDNVLVVDELFEPYVAYYFDGAWYDNLNKVTHWMPLPEPPENSES